MKINLQDMKWTFEPKEYDIKDDTLYVKTEPHTDLWQRTYYHFRNDNAPMYQLTTDEKYFSMVVKADFQSSHRYDQCGIVMYLDSDNWIKASVECDNDVFQHIGVVVTNNGFSDWSSEEIPSSVKSIWYRISRREMDFKVEYSYDGETYKQMRICHMFLALDAVNVGVYVASPEDSTFKAKFSNMELTDVKWLSHDGQAPDENIDY